MSLRAATTISLRRSINVLRLRPCVRWISEPPNRNKPVKFSSSEASGWRAEFTRSGNVYDDSPDAQPFIISFSTAIFLWYFLYYREESDIDENLNIFDERSAYSKVEGLEEVNLNMIRQKKLDNHEDVSDIDQRLKELSEKRLSSSNLK